MRLGPLEQRVLDALWARGGGARVRDLHPSFPEIAYTTLMTTLDRLHRKGVLERVPDGRAFAYRPRFTRAEAVLSFLVDEVGSLDGDALDALERLVRERRRALEEPGTATADASGYGKRRMRGVSPYRDCDD